MKRRLLTLLCCAALLLPAPAARAEEEGADPMAEVAVPYVAVVRADRPGETLLAREPDARCIPASTMKIMTCILALESCGLDDPVRIPGAIAGLTEKHTKAGFVSGETVPMRDVLYGLMLESGNDAALAVAYHLAEDVEAFAVLMNEKAAALGLNDTHFLTPSGTYHRGQYSTARDMALLTAYALQNEDFAQIISTATYEIAPSDKRKKTLRLTNTNRLISDPEGSPILYADCVGGKTGSTEQGGRCLIVAARRDGTTVIAVLLGLLKGGGTGERAQRCYEDAIRLFDAAFARLAAAGPKAERQAAPRFGAPERPQRQTRAVLTRD